MTEPTLDARIARLEDIEAIKTLTYQYAHSVNKGWTGKSVDPAAIAAVFTPGALWADATRHVTLTGAEAIGAALAGSVGGLDLAMHSFTNPILRLTGDTATGNWLIWVAVRAGGTTTEVFQAEDLTYRRGPDGWRIASVALHFGTTLP